ncbi:hypothetical protein ABDK00_006620 [Niabella insulamsoli]|uniref:hypothetical protein n=1 Tax=Niabella insulamsoli TaxID=3144874 RepID=UPI0031FBE5CC
MKTNTLLITLLGIATFMASCSKEMEEVNYTPDVKIAFQQVGDSNIIHVNQGVMEYTANIDVQANGPVISAFEIYTANATNGNRDTLITETAQAFDAARNSYTTTYTIPQLSENRCIKVVVTDTLGRVYEKNLVVKITPAVVFSGASKIETVENFYGPYYANWLSGRVYMRRQSEYKNEIDFSLGDVVIASEGTAAVPALVNPAQRGANGLLTLDGLQNTKFELTTLTAAQYQAITQVDAAPINAIADPTLDVVRVQNGKVYVYKTSAGEKGLIHVTGLTQKSGTIENVNSEWVPQTNYYEATVTTKSVMP